MLSKLDVSLCRKYRRSPIRSTISGPIESIPKFLQLDEIYFTRMRTMRFENYHASSGFYVTFFRCSNLRYFIRADYWKSQARKYCDFCKCWISDNKPSIQFHENGKKHKVNVAAKLKDISKKSIADQKARQKFEDEMKKIEEAATRAYMKDAEQNLDYSSKMVKGVYNSQAASVPGVPYVPPPASTTHWHEAKSDRGVVYYWNSNTGESKWDKPSEGFIPISGNSKKGPKPPKHKKPPKGAKRKGDHKSDKHKKKKKEEEEFVMPEIEPIITGPAYGRWEKVETSNTYTVPEPAPTILDDVPKLEFKEKTLPESTQSSESSSSCSFQFKKSKFRGNARQRSDLL